MASPPSSAIDQTGDRTISTVHHDILQNHILTRLDGPALAALACSSSELHTLSNDGQLWQNICKSTWPSINHPLVSRVISTFPSGHRSFFSDSYPLLHHDNLDHQDRPFPETTELISAVDVYYKNVPIFSEVEETKTVGAWFMCSAFRIDLIEPREFVPTEIQKIGEKDTWLKQLEENVTLSWILIDPKQKRAVNISSRKAVSVQRHWLTGEVLLKFATILAGDGREGSEMERVECRAVVTCGGRESGELRVRDVSMGMDDMEGKALSGKDSLVILQRAMGSGERRKRNEGKERFREFVEMRTERKQRMQKRDKLLDWVCIASGISSFMGFWSFILFR